MSYIYKIHWDWGSPQSFVEDINKMGVVLVELTNDSYRKILDVYIYGKSVDRCFSLGFEAHPWHSISSWCCEWDDEDESYHCNRYEIAQRINQLLQFFKSRDVVTEDELKELDLI